MEPESIRIAGSQSREFARLFGDWNPLHVDPVAARRTLFGGAVVHGMHATLAALDRFLAARGEARALAGLQVAYTAGLRHDEDARLAIEADGPDSDTLRLNAARGQVQAVHVQWGRAPHSSSPAQAGRLPPDAAAKVEQPAGRGLGVHVAVPTRAKAPADAPREEPDDLLMRVEQEVRAAAVRFVPAGLQLFRRDHVRCLRGAGGAGWAGPGRRPP